MTQIDWWAGAQFFGGQMSDIVDPDGWHRAWERGREEGRKEAAAEIERLRAIIHDLLTPLRDEPQVLERPDKSQNEIARSPQWKRWTDYLARKHPTGGG